MSKMYDIEENLMMLADYNDPEPHKHLASHIIISLGEDMIWNVENEKISCRGICINSEVVHTGNIPQNGAFVFLFTTISPYGQSVDKVYLNGKKYHVLDEKIVDEVCRQYIKANTAIESNSNIYNRFKSYSYNNIDVKDDVNINKNMISDKILYESLMSICGLNKNDFCTFDKRVSEILSYIKKQKCIQPSMVDELSRNVFLSKSRLSHIFKKETGMTLHSFLALEKLKKTSKYINEGMNITEASIAAGFDSPSHCAATCKRMFGISLREVYKTIK